jgi:hypothetical protein
MAPILQSLAKGASSGRGLHLTPEDRLRNGKGISKMRYEKLLIFGLAMTLVHCTHGQSNTKSFKNDAHDTVESTTYVNPVTGTITETETTKTARDFKRKKKRLHVEDTMKVKTETSKDGNDVTITTEETYQERQR